jgi:hypothetical protein
LTGQHAAAEKLLSLLSDRADGLVRNAAVSSLKVELYTALNRFGSAIVVRLEFLRQSGVEWSAHPTDQDIRREYERLWRQIGSRPIEQLADLSPMKDPAARATMDVLTKMLPAATFTDETVRRKIIWTPASNLAHHPHLRCDHRAVAQPADPYSQIDVVIEQISIPVGEERPDVDVRIFG